MNILKIEQYSFSFERGLSFTRHDLIEIWLGVLFTFGINKGQHNPPLRGGGCNLLLYRVHYLI